MQLKKRLLIASALLAAVIAGPATAPGPEPGGGEADDRVGVGRHRERVGRHDGLQLEADACLGPDDVDLADDPADVRRRERGGRGRDGDGDGDGDGLSPSTYRLCEEKRYYSVFE